MRMPVNPSASSGRQLSLKALAAASLLALFGLLLLAACGGGDDEEAAGTPSGPRAPASTATAAETEAPDETMSPEVEETATAAPQTSDGELDPCVLVPKQDAQNALWTFLGEPERQTTGPFETCIYTNVQDYVQVQVADGLYSLNTFDNAMQSAAEQLETEAEEVSGLGDKAYWFADVLWVQKGDVTLNILVNTQEITDLRIQEDEEGEKQLSLEITTYLARRAAYKLP